MSMWKTRREEEPQPPTNPPVVKPPVKEVNPVVSPTTDRPTFQPEREATARSGMAHIGKSVLMKGELSGSEDLYIDGQVEGTIELRDNNLTVGPNGNVRANINAREVTVLGRVTGDVKARDKVDIRKSGTVTGNIITGRISIEDGATMKGSVDIQKEGAKAEGVGGGVNKKSEPVAASQPYAVTSEKKLP